MNTLKKHSIKLGPVGVLVLGALSGLLVPEMASAAIVSGGATITIDNPAVISAIPGADRWSFNNYWDSSYNAVAINTDTTGGTVINPTDKKSFILPINVNGTTTSLGNGRTSQATTMDAGNTSVGQIGLSGAFRMGPAAGGTYLGPYDFSVKKVAGQWDIYSHDPNFGEPALFRLGNVSESLDAYGHLLLSGDLFFSTKSYSWNLLLNGNTSIKLGTFSLAPTPAAVPVPAAVWLFGSGLGLLGLSRKKARLTA